MMLGGLPVPDDAPSTDSPCAQHGKTPCGLGSLHVSQGGAATHFGGERRTQRRISRADARCIRVNY